jgi:hypothetical protein
MTNQTSSCSTAAPTPTAAHTLPDRVAALELLVQQMLFVMDAQGTLTIEDLGHWLDTAASRMRATGSVPPAPLRALEALTDMVCE